MKHNDDENLDGLYRAARGFKPDTLNLESHFETRLMARIRERRSAQAEWLSWTWRFTRVFTALALCLGIVTLTMESYRPQDIFASLVNNQEHQIIISYLSGD
jgi:hypothetical protein